jgi:DNA polymerase I-like protein with 3'-5' exonuclease and polymerase domains
VRREQLDLSRLYTWPLVSVDVETTGLHWYRDQVFGIAVAGMDPKRNVMASQYYDIRDHKTVVKTLARVLPRCQKVINHGVKFDAHFLANLGVELPLSRMECTSVRAALINEHELSFSLDALCKKYLDRGKPAGIYDKLSALFGGKATRDVQMPNLHRAPVQLAAEYATPDPELALALWAWQEDEIKKQELQNVWDLERQITAVLVDIERDGVRVDEERAVASIKDINWRVEQAQAMLNMRAGFEVNVNSPPQMRKMLGVAKDANGTWRCGKVALSSTDGGEASIDKEALRLLSLSDERAKLVQQLRTLTKGRQFLEKHIIGHAVDGRVYPNYNQTRGENDLGTGTGRFSIDDPALQQIPKRDVEIATIVRSCFIPEEGDDWLCSDWDQFEFRWFAHYVNAEVINDLYARDPDTDFHKLVADMTGLPRSARYAGDGNAKQINLGLVFGMGEGRMAAEMGLPHSITSRNGTEYYAAGPEAKALFASYHGAIPGIKPLLEQASSLARSRGYVKTVMGRRIRFPHGAFVHKAGGLVFQGSSADCMKQKMVEQHVLAKAGGWKMKLSVHDELDFSVPKGKKRAAQEIKQVQETFDGVHCPIKCRIPIRATVATGPTWWEACK